MWDVTTEEINQYKNINYADALVISMPPMAAYPINARVYRANKLRSSGVVLHEAQNKRRKNHLSMPILDSVFWAVHMTMRPLEPYQNGRQNGRNQLQQTVTTNNYQPATRTVTTNNYPQTAIATSRVGMGRLRTANLRCAFLYPASSL